MQQLLSSGSFSTLVETESLAAEVLARREQKKIILLTGEMGVGKTTLTQCIISALGGRRAEVLSPTFSLINLYQTTLGEVLHSDFYRLNSWQEFEDIGGVEALYAAPLALVEWGDRFPEIYKVFKKQLLVVEMKSVDNSRLFQIFSA